MQVGTHGTEPAGNTSTTAGTRGDEGDVVVRDLIRQYPGGAGVAGIDLTVAKGELIGLLGASGCGKTTTLRCIAGIDTPSNGEICIAGDRVWSAAAGIDVPPERRNIGMVFQSYALWPHLSALENVMYPLRARKTSKREARQRAGEMLELVGLGDMADRSPDKLSGGQQQRVALARALVYRPSLLLFDEPLSNLDAELRETVRQDIKRIQRDMGITALYVTHDRTEAMALSDRVMVMADGRLLQEGTPSALLERPASPFVASLLGSANIVRGVVEQSTPDADDALVTISSDPESGVRFAGRARTAPAIGSNAVVAIRPTELRLGVPNGTMDGWTGEGRVRDWHPTGVEFEYTVETGARALLKVLSHHDLGVDTGDEVQFAYDPATAICFPESDN